MHAPTDGKGNEVKELFYEEQKMPYESCPRNDIKIIVGDANAKIGKEEEFRPIE